MKYIQPNVKFVALMSEDVITASFEQVDIKGGNYGTDKDSISFGDLTSN